MKVIGLIIVAVVVAIAWGGSSVIDKSQQSSDNVAAHVGEISMGMTKDDVVSILGTPEDAQHFESAFAGETTTSDCIYYGSLSSESWQFCFDDGVLTSKNTY